MGAVSGLNDFNSNEVAPLLVKALPYLDGHNRQLAIEALLNSERAEILLSARRQEAISSDLLTDDQWKTAKNVAAQGVK